LDGLVTNRDKLPPWEVVSTWPEAEIRALLAHLVKTAPTEDLAGLYSVVVQSRCRFRIAADSRAD
jgi:hypothetical protein